MARSVAMLNVLAQAYADKVSYAGIASGDPGADGTGNDIGVYADLTWTDDAADGTILSDLTSFAVPDGGVSVQFVTLWSVDDEFLDARPYVIAFDDATTWPIQVSYTP